MRLAPHTLVIAAGLAFTAAFALPACTPPEVEVCEKFKEARDACEGKNGSEAEPEAADLCEDVDPECKEFYDCARQQDCKEVGGVFRLDYATICTMPEGKECTKIDGGGGS